MKRTLTVLSLLICAGLASADTLTSMLTMDELIGDATLGTGVAKASGYAEGNTVYTFTGQGAILNIANDTLSNAFTDKSTLVIAAWVQTTNNTSTQSIFSTGGQANGLKFDLTSGGLECTLKNVSDYASNHAIDRTGATWTLVALSIDLNGGDQSGRLYVSGTDGQFYSKSFGSMNAASPSTFAIGSGNSDSNRELFTGSIANLTIFTSDVDQMQNSVIASAMGAAPALAPVVVPEPATATLSLLALAGLAALRRRK